MSLYANHSGDKGTLKRVGDRVYRVEPDGSFRGYIGDESGLRHEYESEADSASSGMASAREMLLFYQTIRVSPVKYLQELKINAEMRGSGASAAFRRILDEELDWRQKKKERALQKQAYRTAESKDLRWMWSEHEDEHARDELKRRGEALGLLAPEIDYAQSEWLTLADFGMADDPKETSPNRIMLAANHRAAINKTPGEQRDDWREIVKNLPLRPDYTTGGVEAYVEDVLKRRSYFKNMP